MRQSALPPPKDDMERLVRMGELDQAVRSGIMEKIILSSLPPEQRDAAYRAEWNEINRHDLANQSALKAMLPREGWFLKSRYGQNAGQAAFDIVYHAVNDKETSTRNPCCDRASGGQRRNTGSGIWDAV